jgi:hypothetical protein
MNAKRVMILKQLESPETFWDGFIAYTSFKPLGCDFEILRLLLLGISKNYVTFEESKEISYFILLLNEYLDSPMWKVIEENDPQALLGKGNYASTYRDLLNFYCFNDN